MICPTLTFLILLLLFADFPLHFSRAELLTIFLGMHVYKCTVFPSWNVLGLISGAEIFMPLEERLVRTRQDLSSRASGV